MKFILTQHNGKKMFIPPDNLWNIITFIILKFSVSSFQFNVIKYYWLMVTQRTFFDI